LTHFALTFAILYFIFNVGCGYLNGAGPVLISQMMVLCGFFFSLAALGDCSFVELDERLFLPEGPNLPIEVTQSQYIGFLTWQRLDGYVSCDFLFIAHEVWGVVHSCSSHFGFI
jgi:hypothetical protein